MKKILTLFVFVLVINVVRSQTVVTDTAGYTSADKSAVLDVRSTTKGLLLPRLTATQRNGMINLADGLIVYQSSGSTGLYLRNYGSWEKLSTFSLPSLTSGSVLFSDGTTISQDNSNFYWDNTNKRLGIGTSPGYRLHALLSSSGAENWLSYFNVSGGTTDNRAVTGYAHGTTTNYGIFGQAGHASEGSGSYNYGTYGFAYGTSSSAENFGVYGNTTGVGTYNFGVNGKSTGAASGTKYNNGVNGYAANSDYQNVGVWGEVASAGSYFNAGIAGRMSVNGQNNVGASGSAYGLTSGSVNIGVQGWAWDYDGANGGTATDIAFYGINGHVILDNITNSAAELRFVEPNENSTDGFYDGSNNYTAFKAQTQSSNITYTLPSSDGSSGDVLSTDGSGLLSWTTKLSGSGTSGYLSKYSSSTSLSSSILYDDGTNIGISTTSLTSKLDINGSSIRIRTSSTPSSSSDNGYTGEIRWDTDFIYICTNGDGPGGNTDTWKRAAISTW
ncbi:MAG: hypothetical protein GX437_11820 [Sphingobacteriales bacterium]|nr:hypothetical protein [Sphingobacteriales bacterium]